MKRKLSVTVMMDAAYITADDPEFTGSKPDYYRKKHKQTATALMKTEKDLGVNARPLHVFPF